MLDLFYLASILYLGIDDAVLVLEKRGQVANGQLTILVDRGCQDGAAIFSEPSGIVGAATEKRYAERSSSYDHGIDLMRK